jgi:hypothetical protein
MNYLHIESLLYGTPLQHVNAQPTYPSGIQTMLEFQTNRTCSKNPSFDFRNYELNQKLKKYYESSTSWKEFMETLLSLYGDTSSLYEVMFPWYLQAVYEITEGRELPISWNIDSESVILESNYHEGWDVYFFPYCVPEFPTRSLPSHRNTPNVVRAF